MRKLLPSISSRWILIQVIRLEASYRIGTSQWMDATSQDQSTRVKIHFKFEFQTSDLVLQLVKSTENVLLGQIL
jgi:hypothetical protein